MPGMGGNPAEKKRWSLLTIHDNIGHLSRIMIHNHCFWAGVDASNTHHWMILWLFCPLWCWVLAIFFPSSHYIHSIQSPITSIIPNWGLLFGIPTHDPMFSMMKHNPKWLVTEMVYWVYLIVAIGPLEMISSPFNGTTSCFS